MQKPLSQREKKSEVKKNRKSGRSGNRTGGKFTNAGIYASHTRVLRENNRKIDHRLEMGPRSFLASFVTFSNRAYIAGLPNGAYISGQGVRMTSITGKVRVHAP